MPCLSDSTFELFVADRLPPALEDRIAAHLESCTACMRRAEALCGGDDLRVAKANEASADGLAVASNEPEDLREALYQLIDDQVEHGSAASERASELLRLLAAEPSDDVEGARLGRFTVRHCLGAGGFGVVFLAYDELLHREVALKLPRVHALARPAVRERFLREAEAAAQLHHPNVIPVFEAGEAQGICYIAAEYCSGPTLDAWMDEQTSPVPIETAVAIVRQLAAAVQHAHDHRVLHRDIKPSNILLEPNQANPLALTPKIADFGLAKLLESDAAASRSHGMVGTLRYMAPEQASGDRASIGPPTDLFALGAVLYELLTGVAPFASDDEAKTLARLLHDRAMPPRRLRQAIPRDLQAICLKCLERRPEDRYAAAQELADDLHRFAVGRTTRARPIGPAETLRRWMIRQPAIAALLLVSGVGLLSLLSVLAIHIRSLKTHHIETRKAQAQVQARDNRLQNLVYTSRLRLVQQALEDNDLRQASRLLRELRADTPSVASGFAWRYLWNRVVAHGHEIDAFERSIYDLQFSPSGSRLVAGGADGIARIYDGKSFSPLISIATDQGEINSVAFSPDQQSIATAGDDGTVRIWVAATGQPLRTIQAHDQFAYAAVFTADGTTLITCGRDPVIRLWDVASGSPRGTLEGHAEAVEAIALSPDGAHLASVSSDRTARTWELDTGKPLHVLRGHESRVIDIRYSPKGDHLLTGSIDRTLRLWRTADGECLQVENHLDALVAVAFLESDQQLVAADRGGSVHLWQRTDAGSAVRSAAPLHSWKSHEGRTWEVVVSPDRAGVITAGADGKIIRWEQPPTAEKQIEFDDASAEIRDVAFDPSSERLHLIRPGRGLETWEIDRGHHTDQRRLNESLGRVPVALARLPSSAAIVTFDNSTLELLTLPSQHMRCRLETPWEDGVFEGNSAVAISRDGRRLAAFSQEHDATLFYDVGQSKLVGTFEAYAQAMAMSPDGTRLAMSDGDDVVVWDTDRQKLIARLRGHTSSVGALQFSPNGRWLASGSKDRQVRLWDLAGEKPHVLLEGHRAAVNAIDFSPDARLLASGDQRGEVKLWFLAESSELIAIETGSPIKSLMFSDDGNRLALHSARRVRVLNASRSGFGDDAE